MRVAIFLGKFVSLMSQLFRLGAGATWPGEIALRIDPDILRKFSSQGKQTILVAGTNGKTTTAKMLETILEGSAIESVRRNRSGANLENGIVSTYIEDAHWDGTLASDFFIFEVDEAVLPHVLRHLTPTVIILNNLFRDQLDRYGEVDAIAEKWRDALCTFDSGLPAGKAGDQHIKQDQTTVIINADDPQLAYIGKELKSPVSYFGLGTRSLYLPTMQHATDTIYCPNCGARLVFSGVYFSHLGVWRCPTCGFCHPKNDINARDGASPVEGVYNQYNTLAATLAARVLGIPKETTQSALSHFIPAFGRMETMGYQGRQVKILLSKNPTGFNESLRTCLSATQKGPLLLVLNDRIPDGRDVSWIWDVDFETLIAQSQKVFVSGDRVWDMALRLKYAGIDEKNIGAFPSLDEAIGQGIDSVKEHEVLWVLATYSAMLEVRKSLTGRKIL